MKKFAIEPPDYVGYECDLCKTFSVRPEGFGLPDNWIMLVIGGHVLNADKKTYCSQGCLILGVIDD